jgi:hypothetical protein
MTNDLVALKKTKYQQFFATNIFFIDPECPIIQIRQITNYIRNCFKGVRELKVTIES